MGSEFLQIPNGWNVKPLVECTADQIISYGIVQPGSHVGDGVPILRVNNFSNNSLDASTVLKVAPEIEKKFSRTRLKGGEVLLTLVGSTGQSIVAPASLSGWNVARAVAVIRPAQDVGANWINICLQSSATKNFLDSRANTTVQKTLNLQDVKQIPILIPPKDVKEFIESTITSLNCKIELNNQINTTLESMAQALFKSWFVDFDPVIDNAIACGNPIPDELSDRAERRRALKQNPNSHFQPLPTEIQQLFPSSFVLTEEMGWVPERWKPEQLFSEIDVLNGFAFKSEDYEERGIFVLRTKNFNSSNMIDLLSDDVYLPKDFTKSHDKYLCEAYDYHLIMVGASIGNRGMILPHQLPALRNQNMWCFRPKKVSAISKIFTKHLLDSIIGQKIGLASGSAREFFRKGDFQDHFVLFGTTNIQESFSNLTSPLLHRQSSGLAQTSVLVAARNELLPKLLSGQIQIPEAEALLNDTL